MGTKIKNGDFVEVDYVGKVKGTNRIFDLTKEELAKKEGIFDENAKYGAVTVIVGAKHILSGLDNELKKMEIGEKRKVEIDPKDGFGERDTKLIKLVPRNAFKREKINPMPGLPVEIKGKRGIIQTVSGGRIKVDFNHPLAGKTLEYEIEVHKKITKKEEQIKALIEFHIPKASLDDLKVEISQKTAEITTPKDIKTRRYINLTEDLIAKDILKYIKDLDKVKFVDVFE